MSAEISLSETGKVAETANNVKGKGSYVLMYVNVVYDVYALVLEVQFFYWGLFLSAV